MDRIIKKQKWPPRKIAWITIAILIPTLIFLQLVFGDRSSKLNIDRQRLRITQVREGQFQEYIPVTGTPSDSAPISENKTSASCSRVSI